MFFHTCSRGRAAPACESQFPSGSARTLCCEISRFFLPSARAPKAWLYRSTGFLFLFGAGQLAGWSFHCNWSWNWNFSVSGHPTGPRDLIWYFPWFIVLGRTGSSTTPMIRTSLSGTAARFADFQALGWAILPIILIGKFLRPCIWSAQACLAALFPHSEFRFPLPAKYRTAPSGTEALSHLVASFWASGIRSVLHTVAGSLLPLTGFQWTVSKSRSAFHTFWWFRSAPESICPAWFCLRPDQPGSVCFALFLVTEWN